MPGSIKVVDGKVVLYGRVTQIDFDAAQAGVAQKVRIATEETRDSMEAVLEELILGHRREYYYSPTSNYYTYIIRPETVRISAGSLSGLPFSLYPGRGLYGNAGTDQKTLRKDVKGV